MSIPAKNPTALSRLFHLNSEPWLNEEAYRGAPYVQEYRTYPDATRIRLPETVVSAVQSLAERRRSIRAFVDEPLPLASLAALLRCAYGVIGPDPMDGGGVFLRRPVPSAGGLYPLDLFALVRRVDTLGPGIYHFDAKGDALELVSDHVWDTDAKDVFYTWPFARHAPVILCFAAMFECTQKKYGPRGYRYVLLEAGHAAQNLCLVAEDMGLATLCMGGYRDGALNRMIGLKTPEEGVVYTIAAGRGAT